MVSNARSDSTTAIRPGCRHCSKRVIYVGIAEAIGFLVLKITLGLATGSRALLAASLYSVQDLFSSLIAAFGLSYSVKPADRCHPYGHGKLEYLVVALMSMFVLLGVVGLAITALSGFFGKPGAEEAPTMLALWVALVCGVSCWLLSKFQSCAGARVNSPALKSCAVHMHGDYIASAAVVISVIGAKLGYPILDHIVAIAEALHVVFVSGRMLGSALNGLMDSAPGQPLLQKLIHVVGDIDSVTRVRRMTARWSGQTLLAQVEVEVPGQMKACEADELRTGIQEAIRAQVCRRSDALVRILPASGS